MTIERPTIRLAPCEWYASPGGVFAFRVVETSPGGWLLLRCYAGASGGDVATDRTEYPTLREALGALAEALSMEWRWSYVLPPEEAPSC